MIKYRNVPLVKRVCDALEREINNAVREQAMTSSQIQFLLRLSEAEDEALTLKELEAKLSVSQAAIAGLTKRLEQKGYIASYNDLADKRVKHAKLTQLGQHKCSEAHEHMDAIENALGLTTIEARLFNELLNKANENISKR